MRRIWWMLVLLVSFVWAIPFCLAGIVGLIIPPVGFLLFYIGGAPFTLALEKFCGTFHFATVRNIR